jgi:hypothetical protein
MGARSNVFIQDGRGAGVGVYAHWGGEELHECVRRNLPAAMPRAGDPSYFTRILVQRVMNEMFDPNRETGGGLWVGGPDDNSYPILVVDSMTGDTWFVEADATQPWTQARAEVSS